MQKGYVTNWPEGKFVIKNTVPWTYVNSDLHGQEKELQKEKELEKELIIEKVIERKGDKLYVKWKGYNNSLHCWMDKSESYWKQDRSRIKLF